MPEGIYSTHTDERVTQDHHEAAMPEEGEENETCAAQ
jgi:hypothetical protein